MRPVREYKLVLNSGCRVAAVPQAAVHPDRVGASRLVARGTAADDRRAAPVSSSHART